MANSFFEASPPTAGGISTARNQGGEEITVVEDSDVPHKGRDPSGTNEFINTTHSTKLFDNEFQKYVNESSGMLGYKSPQTSELSPSREVSSLPTKLVEGNTGPMGPKHDSGLPDRLLLNATSTCNTSLSTILCRPDSADFRGSNRVTTEGSNRGNSTCRTNRVLFKPFSCPQEGWRTMASNQSQSPKQFCEQGTFQNGGHSYTERSPEKGGLAGQNRYERCLLFNTHSPKPQKIPQVYVQREDLPIQLPTIRPILSPMGVYKNSKTSTSDSPERGVRLIAYIDHLLLLVESKDLITDQVTGMRHLLECLGFIVNTK